MSCCVGPNFYNVNGIAKTAKDLLTLYPEQAGNDGYYYLHPSGNRSSGRQLVYCDMTTDGGGWMMLARSHPSVINYNGQNWGWQGGSIGSIKDHSQAYQAGWYANWHTNGLTFTDFIFGNRQNINNNSWGDFIYKRSTLDYTTFINSDTQQSATYTTIKSNLNVYGTGNPPPMQSAIGYPVTGTTNNIYYMRDCCGYSYYGGSSTGMITTYLGSDTTVYYSGPWGPGTSVDVSGNFLSGTYITAGAKRYGGTNQYMIMVR